MHILLAESDQHLREEIRRKLKADDNVVDVLANGDMALQMILEYRDAYDLIILSSRLPIVDGAAVCKEVKDAGVEIPILLLTTKEDLESRKEVFDCGANDFVLKPFALEELSMRVAALSKQSMLSAPVILSSDDFTLNMLNRTVAKDGEVKLTNKEALLLEYFMKNQNKVVSRHVLFNELWGADSGLLSNVVDAHIKNLRKKLQQIEPGTKRIDSVRGIGYRFNAL